MKRALKDIRADRTSAEVEARLQMHVEAVADRVRKETAKKKADEATAAQLQRKIDLFIKDNIVVPGNLVMDEPMVAPVGTPQLTASWPACSFFAFLPLIRMHRCSCGIIFISSWWFTS